MNHTPTDNKLPSLPKAEALPVGSSPIRVLLLEDNPMDALLIKEMLHQTGGAAFELIRTDSLAGGLHRLAAGGLEVVLLDLHLPDSHGLETFRRLAAAAPSLPIIVLSATTDESLAVEAVHAGAQDYLVKGHVDAMLLGRAIRYAIERKRTAEQLARYAEELRRRNEQMEADLRMAREIQSVFLSQQYPSFPREVSPEQSALRFCHRYKPAASVGGDFFSIFPISDTEAGILICDVVGHGLRAALVTAILRGLMEELTPVAVDPGRFLAGINHGMLTILGQQEEPLPSTAFYMIADVAKSEVRFSSAGHPSPLRVQRHTGRVEQLRQYDARHGPALGLFKQANFPTCRAPLHEDELILLFTDGLYEVVGPQEEEFGIDRVLSSVRRHIQQTPETMVDDLLDEVQSYAAKQEFEDDVCLVTVERSAPAVISAAM